MKCIQSIQRRKELCALRFNEHITAFIVNIDFTMYPDGH